MAVERASLFEGETSIMVFSLLCFLLVLSIVVALFFFFSKKKLVQKELEKKNLEILHQKELLEANLLVQEEERKRIGGELHDDISSQLNLMAMDLQLLNRPQMTTEELQNTRKHLLALITKANESSRKIAHNLFPPLLEKFGLGAAMEELIDDTNFSNVVRIDFENEYDLDLFTTEEQLHIYRIFQELINNSIKHGQASHIQIKVVVLEKFINFSYTDDGFGFNIEKQDHKKSGLGLKNIENRIFFLKGKSQLASKVGKGIRYDFWIPLK
ncbi:Oxygen sensor histidine kinase NreB [Mesonia oceanica]|uniref:Oxygen sensor histidine kinase NreB n=1 Tax=Mesonia oceanica TaxID=2687242 RepID=A0AC61Y3X1_9FLAO|nr:Oxygen sensor histidine kinase NreB [Mesonia oceanica]